MLNLPLIYAHPLPPHLVYVRDLYLINQILICATRDPRVVKRVRVTLCCVMFRLALIYARLAPVAGV